MAVGAVQVYNAGLAKLLNDAEAQWDSSSTFQFALALTGYTPADTHTTWADVSTYVCADGDYGAQLVTTRAVGDSGNPVYATSDDAVFGPSVSISARYLICLQTASAVEGTIAGTDKLVFYQDLNTGGGNIASINSNFTVNMPTNGWMSFGQT